MEDTSHSTKGAAVVFIIGVLGIFAIVGSKLLGLGQIAVTLCPIALMFIYALLLRAPRLRLRDDQSGDNLYYLGFLFTLTSMAVSLREFTTDKSAESIITNFGVAIFTTIAGIIMRVAFNQMRGDTASVERVARMELAETSRRLRAEMDNAILELKQFHRANLQSAEESHTSMRRMAEETFKSLVTSAEEFSRKLTESLSERDAASAESSGNLQKSIAQTAKALDKISAQLDLFKSPDMLIRFDMEPAKEKLDAILEQIRTSQEEHRAQIDQAFGLLHATSGGINELVADSQAFLSDFAPLLERMLHLERRMHSMDAASKRRRVLWNMFGDRSGK